MIFIKCIVLNKTKRIIVKSYYIEFSRQVSHIDLYLFMLMKNKNSK